MDAQRNKRGTCARFCLPRFKTTNLLEKAYWVINGEVNSLLRVLLEVSFPPSNI